MKNKRIQIGAVLAVMLLISMAFVPVMSAQAEKAGKKISPDFTINEWIVDKEDKKEYKATLKQDGIEKELFIKQWQEEVDGIKVWKFNAYEISPDGVIAQDVSFGRGSYFWTDSKGVHFHFSERDKDLIIIGDVAIIGLISLLLVAVNPLIGGAFAILMVAAIAAVNNIEMNNDGSIDVSISWWYVGLIPIYMAKPGHQTIKMKIGSHYYPVLL